MLDFDPEIKISNDLRSGRPFSLEVIIGGDIDLDILLELITQSELDIDGEVQIGDKKTFNRLILVPTPLFGAPIPLVITGELGLSVKGEEAVSAQMDIGQRFQSTYTLEAGFRYQNGRFVRINSADSNSNYEITVRTAAGMMIKFSLIPQLDLGLYTRTFTYIQLVPYVQGNGDIEGTFVRRTGRSLREAIDSSGYRFTSLDSSLGISATVGVDFSSIGLRSLAGSYELFDLNRPLTSLPEMMLDQDRNAVNTYTLMVTLGRWFSRDNEIQEGMWSVVPSKGAPSIEANGNTVKVKVDDSKAIEEGKYKLRYTGYSRYGEVIQQYEEIPIAASGDCAMCPEMVVVPAGSFTMGSPAEERGRLSDEGLQRRVTIPQPFAVGKYEVTVGQYAEFVGETGHNAGNSWRNPGFNQTTNHAVVYVSWNDAKAYVAWLSRKTGHTYRLLTEAEWEYAARAGTTTAYHFGNTISSSQANFWPSGGTTSVGSYPANAFGLHDMHGNVWEWVEDCWHNDYTGAPTNGSAWTSGCDVDRWRVMRGGSWRSGDPQLLRSAYRGWFVASSRLDYYGFRVARTLTP